jgi:hypothetical protein
MKTVGYLSIGLGWLPILGLAAWWAGFLPFPTRPEEIGLKGQSIDGMKTQREYRSLIGAKEAKEKGKEAPYGLNSWYCDKDNRDFCYLWIVSEEPFYGWATPRWVLIIQSIQYGTTPLALYGTYAACKWTAERTSKETENNRVNYERWATEHNQKIEHQEYESYSCVRMPT